MDWLRRFMAGRYGGDQLSMGLFILSILLTFIARLFRTPVLAIFSYIPLGLGLFRMLSRNIQKRSMENYKFAMIMSPVYARVKKMQRRLKELGTHKFIKCPGCRAKLRLPKGKGRLQVSCPKCRYEFRTKT